jgi:hypothetical protein
MTPRAALDFVRRHGVALESATGLEPSLAAKVAGGPVAGHWWAHLRGREFYRLTRRLHESRPVLVCTLAGGRITYIHARLWPAFVRLATRFPCGALDRVREVHTTAGRHRREVIPFPQWVPRPVRERASGMPLADAEAEIRVWLRRYGVG